MKETALWDLINERRERMSFAQRRLWDTISIDPEQWIHRTSAGADLHIWVVALIGRTVISYNDLEHGFDRSNFARYGEITQLGWGQSDLEIAVQEVLNELEFGRRTAPSVSEPKPGTYPGQGSR